MDRKQRRTIKTHGCNGNRVGINTQGVRTHEDRQTDGKDTRRFGQQEVMDTQKGLTHK